MVVDLQKLVILMAHKKSAEEKIKNLQVQIGDFDTNINDLMHKLTHGRLEPIVFKTKDDKAFVLFCDGTAGPILQEVEVHKV